MPFFGHVTMQHFQRLVTEESLVVELQDVEPAAGAAENVCKKTTKCFSM